MAVGIESIRLNGLRIAELPWFVQANLQGQLKLAEDTERQKKIKDIVGRFPTQKVPYLDGALREVEGNRKTFRARRKQEQQTISEYSGLISLCKLRDKELETTDDPKAVKKKYPPYNVEAMEKQVTQSHETVARIDVALEKEHNSIVELREVRGLCVKRDEELTALGVKIE